MKEGRITPTITKDEAKTQDVLSESAPAVVSSSEPRTPATFQEVYPIQEPYVYAAIVKDPETQKIMYQIIEPTSRGEAPPGDLRREGRGRKRRFLDCASRY